MGGNRRRKTRRLEALTGKRKGGTRDLLLKRCVIIRGRMDEDTEMRGGELLTRGNTVFSGDKCVGETSGNGGKLEATKKRDLDSSATK